MSLKLFLILMTAIAVVSDSMLHPFYPQYFSSVFGVSDSEHVGFYIASCSLTVILSFPLWALMAKRVNVLKLLVGTQVATGVLSMACSTTSSLQMFWFLSLTMMVFKASYLLIYPYVLSVSDEESQMDTISLLALVVYFGNILAALLSGTVFQWFDARSLFVVMACGDALQILLCLVLLRQPAYAAARQDPDSSDIQPGAPQRFVYKLGAVMFVLYFSAYVTEPFFSTYWEDVSSSTSKILAGAVFAIPGLAALAAMFFNSRREEQGAEHASIAPAIAVGICGLLLQISGQPYVVLAGRFAYGWALFQAMVRLDLVLFQASTPESYAVDFSKINLCQGLGVLFASFTAGSLVHAFDTRLPFIVAAVGFVGGGVLYFVLLRKELGDHAESALPSDAIGHEGPVR